MSSNAALTLSGDDLLPSVKVRASAVFSILSSYVRRGEKQARVIGTLMGTVNEGNVVEVRMIIWYNIEIARADVGEGAVLHFRTVFRIQRCPVFSRFIF